MDKTDMDVANIIIMDQDSQEGSMENDNFSNIEMLKVDTREHAK